MMNVEFEGAVTIGKPPSMTDEQCSSAWAMPFTQAIEVTDEKGNPHHVKAKAFLMCYQPSKEDMEAIAAGQPIWLKILAPALPPHSMWTHNALTGDANF
jgi:hypothetical protein